MKRLSQSLAAVLLAAALLCGACLAAAEEPREVSPAENYYGWANRDRFASFDSGIEGARVEPVFGELITPDPETEYRYGLMEQAFRQMQEDTAALAGKAFAGEIPGEAGTPAQRLHDLYDACMNLENDAEAEDRMFLDLISPLISAQDPEALRTAADELYAATGIHVLYGIKTLQEGHGTNRTLPCVSAAVPSFAEKIAFDPEAEEKYAGVYRNAMGEFARGVGLDPEEGDLAEAWRMQTALCRSDVNEMQTLFRNTRRQRAAAEADSYGDEALAADMERLEEIHPAWSIVVPEGLNETEAAVYRKIAYLTLDRRITREAEETESLPEGAGILQALRQAGFSADSVIITPDDYEAMKGYAITAQNLAACKLNAVLVFSEKTGYAPSACRAAAEQMSRAADCAVWGSDSAPEQAQGVTEEKAQAAVLKLLPQDPGLLWAQENYDNRLTEKTEQLIGEIREAYTSRFIANDWLQEDEKQLALSKLANMSSVAGIPTEENYGFPAISSRAEGGTYLSNRIAISRRDLRTALRLVNEEGFDRTYFAQPLFYSENQAITANIINAAANTGCVSIVVPAGLIWQTAEITADDFEFRTVLGFVIAHEIGHHFDSDGSLCDDRGVPRNWWSEESRARFGTIVQQFEELYGRFEYAEGLHQEFEGDYSECMADYAGFRIVLDIIGEDAEVQGRFFSALAGSFLTVWSRPALELYAEMFTSDNHPYGALRINPLVTSTDAFYGLCGVKEGDQMYTAPEDRLELW